jgi:hypothetical protein
MLNLKGGTFMKYSELINFNPIETVISINDADDNAKAVELTKSYVMSDDMAEKLNFGILNELQLEEVIDNKGVLIVGNYGTGKSHLMSVISSVALEKENLQFLQNKKFADYMERIAGKFEVLRIEIGAVAMTLRNIILNKVEQDFKKRGLTFTFPKDTDIINNRAVLENMMSVFLSKYPGKGYLIVVDELLDYLASRKEHEIKLDLGFMRELGEIIKKSRFRIICGVQEKLFDNPNFSFVSNTLNRVKDRFEQVIIRKEDTAYVVSQRILQKTPEQKAKIRAHLQMFCSLYTNMSEQIESYVELFPIHPAYIDVFNKIYIIENRHILKNISISIREILVQNVPEDAPGIISFDDYWQFIKENYAYKTDSNIKEVISMSIQLEDIINRSFPKPAYKKLAVKIIYALSVHRLTTVNIDLPIGLTAQNLRDDLCLYLNMPERNSDFLLSVVQQILKDIITTVSGQFIEYNNESLQYFLNPKIIVNFDIEITKKAAIMDDDSLNRYFFHLVYDCLEWDEKQYVPGFEIYEYTLSWVSHNIFRYGYLFMGLPNERSTAQPPQDFYIYIIPPYDNKQAVSSKEDDEVYFYFKNNEDFKNNLKLYAAALINKELSAEENNKVAYQNKANIYKKYLMKYLNENKSTCFDVVYKGTKHQLIEVLKGKYNSDFTFKDAIDTAASICFDEYFSATYPNMPVFKVKITKRNLAETIRIGIDYYAGRKSQSSQLVLESFGLLDDGKVKPSNSKYAAYYINMLSALPSNGVINFREIFEENFDDFLDRQFKVNRELMVLVLLSLVVSGDAVIQLGNNITLTASNLDILPKTNAMDIYDLKYISKPMGIHLPELLKLFEILDIPAGLINNPNQREKGLEELIKKTNEIANLAISASTKLNGDFELWGEPLIAEHIVSDYKKAITDITSEFGNFGNKFNTVAKLNNFTLTLQRIDELEKNINIIKIVLEYDKFKNGSMANTGYIMNLELMDLDAVFKSKIEAAKARFHEIRDAISQNKSGESAAFEINGILTVVKDEYIDIYFSEHNRKRLGVKDGQRKGEILNSPLLTNLRRLKGINILSTAKLTELENILSSLQVCYELTPVMLKSSHICPRCKFKLGENSRNVIGQLSFIEDKFDALFTEWTSTLLNTITDPLVLSQKEFLKPDQQKIIDEFIANKQLPAIVDNFFLNSIISLLQGFDPVVISSEELINKIDEFGPCEVDTFRDKLMDIVLQYTKGKDKSKLRIIVKRQEHQL